EIINPDLNLFMKQFGLWLMVALYFSAGILHFATPEFYVKLIPVWLPAHLQLVWISGAAEIALAILLLLESTRKIAAWLTVAMLVVFFFLIHMPITLKFYNVSNRHFLLNC